MEMKDFYEYICGIQKISLMSVEDINAKIDKAEKEAGKVIKECEEFCNKARVSFTIAESNTVGNFVKRELGLYISPSNQGERGWTAKIEDKRDLLRVIRDNIFYFDAYYVADIQKSKIVLRNATQSIVFDPSLIIKHCNNGKTYVKRCELLESIINVCKEIRDRLRPE